VLADTEFNNYDWWQGGNVTFMKLYDHTVCGLRKALGGRQNLIVGAHGCLQCEDDDPPTGGGLNWDPRNLLDHVHRNVSACETDGDGGTQLDYLSTSFYEKAPGAPGDLSAFDTDAAGFRSYAKELGMDVDAMFFGIDEGRILGGPTEAPRQLTSRAVGTSYQASWDALFFHKIVYGGLS